MLTKYDQLKYVVCFALVSLGSLLSQNSKSYFDCPCPQIIAHQGSSLEFMQGNKVVLEATDTFTAESDVNSTLDVALTIMEIT